jgi:hypothetical protein
VVRREQTAGDQVGPQLGRRARHPGDDGNVVFEGQRRDLHDGAVEAVRLIDGT